MFKLFLSEFTAAWQEGRVGDGLRAAGKICNAAGDAADLLLDKPTVGTASVDDCDAELIELEAAITAAESAPAASATDEAGNPIVWIALAKAIFDIVSEIRKNRKK